MCCTFSINVLIRINKTAVVNVVFSHQHAFESQQQPHKCNTLAVKLFCIVGCCFFRLFFLMTINVSSTLSADRKGGLSSEYILKVKTNVASSSNVKKSELLCLPRPLLQLHSLSRRSSPSLPSTTLWPLTELVLF